MPLPQLPSYSDMMTSATTALGKAGSMFKNPAQAGIDSVSVVQAGVSYLMSKTVNYDPTFVPPSFPGPIAGTIISLEQHISSSIAGITSGISDKLSNFSSEILKIKDAADRTESAKAVDAILSKNLKGIPSQINVLYPGADTKSSSAAPPNMDAAFTPLTASNAHVSDAASAMAAEFDNVGFMVPFFTALNGMPGMTQLVTGTDLLTYIGTVPDKTYVDAAFASVVSPDFISGLETAFKNVGSHTTTMSSGFSDILKSAKDAVAAASGIISGGVILSLLSDVTPQIKALTDKIIDRSAINQRALDIKSAIDNKQISLPGAESLAVSNPANKTLPDVTNSSIGISAANIISPPAGAPAIVEYDSSQLINFRDPINAALDENNAKAGAAAAWFKENVEDWKISTGYAAAKSAAGATKEFPYGTSTDQAALDAWKPLLEEQRRLVAKFNAEYYRPNKVLYDNYEALLLEWSRRVKYGKYPYTVMKYSGATFTPEEETTLLDTTK